MTWNATVGGTTVNGIVDVNYSGQGSGRLGTAEIEAQNTPTNRGFSYGDEVVVKWNGTTEFTGNLTGKPSTGDRNLTVTIEARDKRDELKYQEVHRPFFDVDSGAAIREAVEYETEPRDPVDILLGLSSEQGNLSSDAPVLELADLSGQDFENRGDDMHFLYWNEGATGAYELTYSNVPSSAVGNILWLETRYLFNNRGGHFSVEVELRDGGGTTYVWDLNVPETPRFQTERLQTEQADPDGSLSSDLTLQYRIEIEGALPEPRAAVVDFARTRPFYLRSRSSAMNTSGVENTGRDIVRRADSTILEFIQQLAVEDGATSFVDENDVLHYEPSGDETAPESITYSSSRVSNVEVDRNSADIVNKVVAQGAGDLQEEYRSSSSIDFYGVSPREQPLVDKSIQNRSELDAYAEGFLDEIAWEDTAATFTLADRAYARVRQGQAIFVEWPPEGIGPGTFVVSSVNSDSAGRVDIGITGHGGI